MPVRVSSFTSPAAKAEAFAAASFSGMLRTGPRRKGMMQ